MKRKLIESGIPLVTTLLAGFMLVVYDDIFSAILIVWAGLVVFIFADIISKKQYYLFNSNKEMFFEILCLPLTLIYYKYKLKKLSEQKND